MRAVTTPHVSSSPHERLVVIVSNLSSAPTRWKGVDSHVNDVRPGSLMFSGYSYGPLLYGLSAWLWGCFEKLPLWQTPSSSSSSSSSSFPKLCLSRCVSNHNTSVSRKDGRRCLHWARFTPLLNIAFPFHQWKGGKEDDDDGGDGERRTEDWLDQSGFRLAVED